MIRVLEMQIVVLLIKEFLPVMELQGSLQCSNRTGTRPHLEPVESRPHCYTFFI